MRYYKRIENGLLLCIGTGLGGIEITAEEYNTLLGLIYNKPTAPEGYEYCINDDNEYVLVEAPVIEADDDDELTEDEAFAIIIGGAV